MAVEMERDFKKADFKRILKEYGVSSPLHLPVVFSCYSSASFQHRPPSSPHSKNIHVSLLGDLQTEENRG